MSKLVTASGVSVTRRVMIYVSESRLIRALSQSLRRDRGDAARSVFLKAVKEWDLGSSGPPRSAYRRQIE